jgi:hypothetical protein
MQLIAVPQLTGEIIFAHLLLLKYQARFLSGPVKSIFNIGDGPQWPLCGFVVRVPRRFVPADRCRWRICRNNNSSWQLGLSRDRRRIVCLKLLDDGTWMLVYLAPAMDDPNWYRKVKPLYCLLARFLGSGSADLLDIAGSCA